MRLKAVLLGIALSSATPLFAQLVTVGRAFSGSPNAVDAPVGAVPETDIDLTYPATATGTLTSATVFWASAPCTNGFKIKIFHRSGNTLTLAAERGPFSNTSFSATVILSPPLDVKQGDLIGVARMTSCGLATIFLNVTIDPGFVLFGGDVSGSVNLSAAIFTGNHPLALYATGPATEVIGAVLPVVGATAGSFGARFTTSLQMANGTSTLQTGKLVFHPLGASGTAGDPTVTYTVPPNTVFAYPDLMSSLGVTGVGSLDLVVTPGAAFPLTITRVYNDAGAAGTAGLSEDAIDPNDIGTGSVLITTGRTALMITPVEPARTRFNIGVRTLSAGATFTATLRNPDGSAAKTVTKTYGPTWFEQVDSTTFFGGTAIGASQTILINVTAGSVIVYGSTTDNVTNDPALQYARVLASD